MSYSFIQPKPKAIFKRFTKIWFVYLVIAVGVIFAYGNIIKEQIVNKINEQARIEQEIQSLKLKSIVMKDYIERLDYEVRFTQEVAMQNQMLEEGVSNLLKLIPEQITAKNIELGYNQLTMRGVTPSKEVYKFLLEAPLRAVFHQTRVEFYPLVNGWFNFVSVSKSTPAIKPLKIDSNEEKQ